MTELIAIITPIALLDSLSMIPVGLLPIIILLTSKRPVYYTFMFLLGLVVVYIPFGLILVFGFSSTFDAAGKFVSEWIKQEPNCIDLLVQFIIGIALLILGYRIASRRTRKLEQQPQIHITAISAFTFAAVLMLTGLWGALPYFAAVDQILRADPGQVQQFIAIIIYNFVFISPFIVMLIIGIVMGPGARQPLEKLVDWLLHFGKAAITIALYVLGVILIADAIGWYFDMPIIPTG